MLTYENLIIEKEEGIALMYINRPKALNAINADVLKEMEQAIDALDADDEVRVVIITGAGEKSFVAGADIVWMYNMAGASFPPMENMSSASWNAWRNR